MRKPLKTRITEHNRKWNWRNIHTEHFQNEDHRIQWNEAQIICEEENRITRKLKELLFTRTNEQVISQPSIEMCSI
jgi:hypothetical protein